MMPEFMVAGLWGLLSGSGLLVGAIVADAFYGRLTHRMVAAIMGFGGGVLIAVVGTELIGERVAAGMGPLAISALLAGAAIFSGLVNCPATPRSAGNCPNASSDE